jgi:hypothetical protein
MIRLWTIRDESIHALELPKQLTTLLQHDATRRGTYVVKTTDGIRVISEPPPDVALETITKLAASVTPGAEGISGEGSVDVTETIKALTRAVEISFLRESLFRAGEAYVNGGLEPAQYQEYLDQITRAATFLAGLGKNANLNLPEYNELLIALFDLRSAKCAALVEKLKERTDVATSFMAMNLNPDETTEAVNRFESLTTEIEALEQEIAELSAITNMARDLGR